MDADLTLKTVQTFLHILKNRSFSGLIDLSTLPFSKETAKCAIQAVWFATENDETRQKLKTAYIRIADFQFVCNGDITKMDTNFDPEKKRREEIQSLKRDIELWERDEFE